MVEKKKRDNKQRNINIIKAALGTLGVGALGYALLKNRKKLKNVINNKTVNKAVDNKTLKDLQDVVDDGYVAQPLPKLKNKSDKSAQKQIMDLINDPRAPKFRTPVKMDVDVEGFWRKTPDGKKTWVKGHTRKVKKAKNVVEKAQVKPQQPQQTLQELLEENNTPQEFIPTEPVKQAKLTPEYKKQAKKRKAKKNNKIEKGYANKSTTTLQEDLATLLEEDSKLRPQNVEDVVPNTNKKPTLQDKIRQTLNNPNLPEQQKLLSPATNNPKRIVDNEQVVKQQLGKPNATLQELLEPKLEVDVNNQLRRKLKDVNKPDVKLPQQNKLEQQVKETLEQPVITPRNIGEVLPPKKEPTLQDKIREVLGKPTSGEQKLLPASRNNPPLRNTTQESIEQSLRPNYLPETTMRSAKLGKRTRLQQRKSIERSFFKPKYEELPNLKEIVDDVTLAQEFIPTQRVKRAKLSKRYKQRNRNLVERVNKLELQKSVNDFNTETAIRNAEQSAIAKQGFVLQPVSEVKTRQSLSPIRQQRIETRLSKERKSQRIVDDYNNLQERIKTYEQQLDEQTTQAIQTKINQFEKKVNDVLTSAKQNKPRSAGTNKLNTQEYVRQIDGLQQQVEEYVNNPFVDDGVFGRIRTAKKTLGETIGEEVSELSAKFKQLDVDEKTVKQLEKEYGELLKTFAAKKEQLRVKNVVDEEDIAQRIRLLQEELGGVNKDNVLQQTLDDKAQIEQQLTLFSSRKNRGVTSRAERELARTRTKLTKASQNVATSRRRLRDTYQTQLDNLTMLQQRLKMLPTNEGRLSKLQKIKLREVKQLGKTIGEDYNKFRKLYSDAQQFEEQFEKRYNKLSKEISDLNNQFENGVVRDNYFADIASDAEVVNAYDTKMRKDADFLRKVYDPQSYDSYIQAVDGNIVGSPLDPSNTSSVKQAMRIKRQLLEGGYIDGKKYRPLYQEVLVSGNKLEAIVANKKAMGNLNTTRSLVEKKQQELDELVGNYIDYKNNTLQQYDELYNRLVFLEDGDLAKMQQLRKNITNNNYATSFGDNKEVLETLTQQVDDIASYKPRYVYVGGDKVRRNVTPGSSNLTVYDPTTVDGSQRRLVLQDVVKTDKTSDQLNVATVNSYRKLARLAKNNTVNNRMTVAGLYFELEKRGIEIEGNNNFLKRMFDNNAQLSDAEQQFMTELSDQQKTLLRDFVSSGSSDDFEQYHYHNTVNYLLSGKTDQGVNLSEELRDTLRINENPLAKNVRKYFTDAVDSNVVDKKLSEVNQVVRDLNSLGEKVQLNNTTTLDGTLSVDNLPPILPGESYKKRNFLVKKLQKLIGVNDDGMPIVDFATALDLAGVNVNNREQLKEYIEFMRKRGYAMSSYNNLALARKLNEDVVDEYSSRLYRYNFAKQKVDEAQFAQL